MRNAILILIGTLVVMGTTPINNQKIIQDSPHTVQKINFIKPLTSPVYAEKQQLAKVPVAVPKTAPVASGSESEAKAFIYAHESGNNPGSINKSSGACGLGQALPCSKMGCSLSDYACQDAWFTGYMQSRYKTWSNAKAFWLSHKWW
jgi:hypothetical protein